MSDGNPCISSDGVPRGNARHNFELDAGTRERLRLLASAPEHKRIAAFQTTYQLTLAGTRHEELVDIALPHAIGFTSAPHANLLSLYPRQAQQVFVYQEVVDDAVGSLEDLFPLERQQPRVAGSRANEIDFA
jgi:hypothetical protein